MKNIPFLSVVKNKNFRNLWLGQIVSQIALNMLSFVLAIRVYHETGSNIAVSLMLLCFAVPSVIFGIAAGGIVDYFDKRDILVFCNISRFFILILFFFLSSNLIALYILSIFISIITQLFIPAEGPTIPNLVDQFSILTANSLFTVSFYLSSVLGFILAGPLILLFGHKIIYLFMAFLLGIASYYVSLIPSMKTSVNRKVFVGLSFFTKTANEGFRFIKSNKRIEQSLILLTFSQSLITTLAVLAPGFADRVLSIALTDASYLVMGPAALGLIIGALWVGGYGMKYLKGTIIMVGILALGISLILLSLVSSAYAPSLMMDIGGIKFVLNNLTIAFILLLALGIFNSFVSVPSNTILQEDADERMRGRVYGVLTSLTGGVSIIPVIFSGILADVVGVEKTLLILGTTVLFIGFYHYLQRKKSNYNINK